MDTAIEDETSTPASSGVDEYLLSALLTAFDILERCVGVLFEKTASGELALARTTAGVLLSNPNLPVDERRFALPKCLRHSESSNHTPPYSSGSRR